MIKEALQATWNALSVIMALLLVFVVMLTVMAVTGLPIYYFLINYCNYTIAWILGVVVDFTLDIFILNLIIAYLEKKGK